MNFYPYGPFEVPRNGSVIDNKKESKNEFWKKVDDQAGIKISKGVGCYIYSIRAAKGILPWYVGMTKKQTFDKECFAHQKLTHYNNSIANRKGTPVMTFILKFTENGKMPKASINGNQDISFLEKLLISTCLLRNPNLLNSKGTRFARNIVVPGLINNPKGCKKEDNVKQLMALLGT